MKICDLIFASYEKFFHSSNILTKSAAFARPVVVSEGYCMAERTQKYDLGVVVAEKNVSALVKAVEAVLDGHDQKGRRLQADYAGYSEEHSYEKLKIFLGAALRLTWRSFYQLVDKSNWSSFTQYSLLLRAHPSLA